MKDSRALSVVTIGGKGSSLSSASVFAVANGLAQVRVDSSALDKLSQNKPSCSEKFQISFAKWLTREEVRAYLVVLLNKLLLSSTGIRPLIPNLISQALNSGVALDSEIPSFDAIDVCKEELVVLEKSSATLDGICAILDHQSSALSTVADAVAALSCEALRAKKTAFDLIDSGDGFTAKDEVGVASDMKVLHANSSFVDKVEVESVSEIPKVHGKFREIVRLVHGNTRVVLNSTVQVGEAGVGKAMATTVSPLALALWCLAESSWCRGKLNIDSITNDSVKTSLLEMFIDKCPTLESLKDNYRLVLDAIMGKEYVKLLHEVNALLVKVREVIAWEAMGAWISLERVDPSKKPETNEGNAYVEKKIEKKKKGLGKGTTVVMQLIKEQIQSNLGDVVDGQELTEKHAAEFCKLLDPKAPQFDSLLKKVKDIVESNESRRLPKLPKGTRDFANEQMVVREKAFSIIKSVFKRHGATALDTPVFELRETLMGKYGEDSKLIYDLADQGGELCSLRYDLTVPFARYMAMNGLSSFKRYQIDKVYRRDNPSKGRYREFYQCDFDIAGQYETMGPDFEVVRILTELLDELDVGDYEVKINHRKLLDGMLDICGVPSEKFRTICSSIDKLDKQSFEQVKREMVEEKGLAVETADEIGTFVKERGHPLKLLTKLKQDGSKFLENEGSVVALNELEILFKALERSKCIGKVVFDLSLARGLDYYTGVIFEAVFKGTMQVGSIAAGGRYDNLVGMFGTRQVAAVGVSLGIERVFAIMEERLKKKLKDQNQAPRATETQVLMSLIGDDLPQAAEIVSELWDAKLNAEYMVNKRPAKHYSYAEKSKIPWMVIVGERELDGGVARLKDMEGNKEEVVPRSRVVEELKRRLDIDKPT